MEQPVSYERSGASVLDYWVAVLQSERARGHRRQARARCQVCVRRASRASIAGVTPTPRSSVLAPICAVRLSVMSAVRPSLPRGVQLGHGHAIVVSRASSLTLNCNVVEPNRDAVGQAAAPRARGALGHRSCDPGHSRCGCLGCVCNCRHSPRVDAVEVRRYWPQPSPAGWLRFRVALT